MLRVDGADADRLETTTLETEDFNEDHLREWLMKTPESFLQADLLVIGREVGVEGVNDAIDVLGIDPDGNLVVIELKRGVLRGNVDFQSLKYASYVSRWGYSDVKSQFQRFGDTQWGESLHGQNPDFEVMIEEFCNEDYEINKNQRIVLVGDDVRERIGSVVIWLNQQGVDASIVEFTLFKAGDNQLYLDGGVTVPTPTDIERFEIGEYTTDEPWKENGRDWHLEERANEDTRDFLQRLVNRIVDLPLDGPHWNQKTYISFKIDRRNTVLVIPRVQSIQVKIVNVAAENEIDTTKVAEQLGIDEESVKVNSPSSRTEYLLDCPPSTTVDSIVGVIEGLLDINAN